MLVELNATELPSGLLYVTAVRVIREHNNENKNI
jgi:hypothetical protein